MLVVTQNEKGTSPSSSSSSHHHTHDHAPPPPPPHTYSHTHTHAPPMHHNNHHDDNVHEGDSRTTDRERNGKTVRSAFDATPVYSLQQSTSTTPHSSHPPSHSPHPHSSSRHGQDMLSHRKDAKILYDEEELPPHWSWDETEDGEIYYTDHDGETTWDDPRENFEDFFKCYLKAINA